MFVAGSALNEVSDLQTVTVDATFEMPAPTDAVKEAATWATAQTAREQIIEIRRPSGLRQKQSPPSSRKKF